MASVIWPTGNRWGVFFEKKIMTGVYNTKVIDQPGNAVIIAKGNRYERIEAIE